MTQCQECGELIPENEIEFCSDQCYSRARRRATAQRRRGANPPIVPVGRYAVWVRDGKRCRICGTALDMAAMTFDHVLPLAEGGNHTPDNVQSSCLECNLIKGRETQRKLDWPQATAKT